MANSKLMVLGTKEDFTTDEVQYFTALIQRELKRRKLAATSFAFHLRVEYQPETKTKAKNKKL